MGPGAPISTNLQLSAIRQQFYTEWMCDAGIKILDYLKVKTNKKECTERIESGYKDLAKIFVESVSIDFSEDNIVEELSKLKKDNTEYNYAMEEYDKLIKNEQITDRMLVINEHKYNENNEINSEQINNENLKMDEEEDTDWLKYLDFC
uniref:Uncharacterized protein n=3 Tax=Meloidogyne TaxID=189290 RepID=A0A6V7XBW4_MELEN|nr:unnamed protein product [Meloidogyne enterolobii]